MAEFKTFFVYNCYMVEQTNMFIDRCVYQGELTPYQSDTYAVYRRTDSWQTTEKSVISMDEIVMMVHQTISSQYN